MSLISKFRGVLAAMSLLALLSGCAATSTAVAKRELDVQTKMTDTIFLDPVSADRRTVFVQVRNTSDRPDFVVEPAIRSRIEAAGYRIVDDPDQAQYMLQANVLQAGRSSETAADAAGEGGFGSAVSGAAVGAGTGLILGKAGGSDVGLTIGGALLGAAIGTAVDAYVQDVTYSVITDIRVSERAKGGAVISQSETQTLDQGSGGEVTQATSTLTDWKHYQTRIVAVANKVNLDWEQAAPFMVEGLTRSIGGIF